MDSTSTIHLRGFTSENSPTSPSAHSEGHRRGAVKSDDRVKQTLARLYGPVFKPLKAVERRLHQELQSQYEALVPVLRHGTQLGGKRLRPAMLLLSGGAVGELTDDHVLVGTVIEMVHTATLVHDDVLDQASTRRHVATINARWNEHTSILLGDYLFAQSFRLAATLSSTEACRWIGEAARLVCEGELRQVLQRDVIDIDEETYFDVIRGKTAELCRVACQLGAVLSTSDAKVIDALGVYGSCVGIAFQIADDYLDLWGDDETIGKTLGTDISQGKMTLPMIRLLETASTLDRARVVEILRGPADHRLDRIRPYLRQSDARQYTRDTALRFRDRAIGAIDILSDSEQKRSLAAIANFSVERRF
jgi:octaprenyl-diphosphate synthase